MPSQIASLVFVVGIIALFVFEKRQEQRTSASLWIAVIYFFIIASRPVSVWFGAGVSSTTDLQDGSPLDAAVYALLYVLAAVVLIGRRTKVTKLLSRSWPVLLFFGYCLISLAWSDYPMVALKRWVKLLGDLMMVLVIVSDPYPMPALKRFLARTAFVLLPVSVLFIKYYPQLGRGYDPWTGAQYFHGISYNKNGLGAICLFWGIAFTWLFAEAFPEWRRKRTPFLIAAVVLSMSVWSLTKASSATSQSCLLMAAILITMARIRWISRLPVILHCAVLGMVGAAYVVLFVDTSALGMLNRDPTLTGRTELWDAIFKIPQNPIVGAGYESFWTGWRIETLWSTFWWRPTQAHNGFIEIFINLGGIGIFLLALMWFVAYSRAISAVRRREAWGALLLAYIVITIPYNFTEATFRTQNLTWLFLLLAVSGIPMTRSARKTDPSAESVPDAVGVDDHWQERLLRQPLEKTAR